MSVQAFHRQQHQVRLRTLAARCARAQARWRLEDEDKRLTRCDGCGAWARETLCTRCWAASRPRLPACWRCEAPTAELSHRAWCPACEAEAVHRLPAGLAWAPSAATVGAAADGSSACSVPAASPEAAGTELYPERIAS